MKKNLTYQEAKVKIENWCAYQERCQFEVSNKLQVFGLSYNDIQHLIAELITNNFINEERFAESYVSGKFRIKRWGRIKIKQHLKQKQISDYSITKAFKQITKEEYTETILKLIEKKSSDFKPTDTNYTKKAKIHNYLASKGFEFQEIENAWDDFQLD